MFDSGSARNLIAQSLVDEFPEFLESVGQVVQLETAGGRDTCETAIRYLNADAGFEEVYALVLKDTPTVLSMGAAVALSMGE